jgi:hypothetical protein
VVLEKRKIEIAQEEGNDADFGIEDEEAKEEVVFSGFIPVDGEHHMPHQVPTLERDRACDIQHVVISANGY